MVKIDMEMPERCDDCPLRHRDMASIIVNDRCGFNMKCVDPYTFGNLKRPYWCPLIEAEDSEEK